MKKNIISIIITIIIGSTWYYFMLPPINIHCFEFWGFVALLLGVFSFSSMISEFLDGHLMNTNKKIIIPVLIITLIGLGIGLTNFILSPVFQSEKYAKRIKINEEGVFTEDVKQVDFNALPLLDKDSSTKLGDRVMGQMPEMVSQFYVSNNYTQINYNNSIVRVTPLEYNGFFKYINNRKKGVTGYITVNSVSGESKLIKLDKGMKYMPSAIFNKDLYRHLRLSYPFDIFDKENFEIDNEGNPYWIVPIVKYKGVGLRKDISHVIILNPVNGKSKKYKVEDVPTWVDHVYRSDLIIEQVDNWGEYKSGYLNSIFGQKNVVMTTEGYNYTVMNDDVYLYTGITSVSNDEANIGFIMTNLRTKETTYYATPGAEEYSAMASAEGQVQQMKYTATFPLLINLNDKPTYLISLKDNAGLVKMYAFVDVVDYQKVVVTDASVGIEKAAENYLGEETIKSGSNDLNEKITITKITSATIDGTTYYYLIDHNNQRWRTSIKVSKNLLPFLDTNSQIKVWYKEKKEVTEITKIEESD